MARFAFCLQFGLKDAVVLVHQADGGLGAEEALQALGQLRARGEDAVEVQAREAVDGEEQVASSPGVILPISLCRQVQRRVRTWPSET